MTVTLPLNEMSTADKLRVLEELWADLSRTPDSVPAPAWHAEVLGARERAVAESASSFEEWSAVKQRIRNKTR